MSMRRLVYVSHTTHLLTLNDQIDILRCAHESNQRMQITGVLFQCDNTILQLLEGEHEAVASTFERIRKDPRHRDVTRLVDVSDPTGTRLLPGWKMGFYHLSSTEDAIGEAILRNDDHEFLDALAFARSDVVAGLLREFWLANRGSLCLRRSQTPRVAAL